MANYTVTNASDSGAGSLRQAIAQANNNPGLDKIDFEVINVELNSAILISDEVEITGNGAVIAQTKGDRLFNISDGDKDNLIDVTLANLTLRGGKSSKNGGAINAVENLTVDKVTLENNAAQEKGGAVYLKNAKLTITDSLLQNNSLTGDNADANGAAIYVTNGNVAIEDSSFTNNKSKSGAISVDNTDATIANSSIMDNQGLGILATAQSSLNLNNSNVSNNSNGGIFAQENSKLNIANSSLNNNEATVGAGINLTTGSEAKIFNSIIIGNVAQNDGGGIRASDNSDLTLTNTTIELNEAAVGSAVSLKGDSSALLMDTTVKENTGSEVELAGDNFTVENTPVVAPGEANLDLTDVHRFFQYNGGFHFYTSDTNEIAVIRAQSAAGKLPYNYEAEQFTVLAKDKDAVTGAIIEGAKPVYRFFNTATGSHLYTMDENERGFITQNLDNYNFEGINYYAFEEKPESIETVPVFRLLNGISGSHLFTVDQNEVNFIKDNLSHFSVEGNSGVAYHVFELEAL